MFVWKIEIEREKERKREREKERKREREKERKRERERHIVDFKVYLIKNLCLNDQSKNLIFKI